jgi:hypothetical protein
MVIERDHPRASNAKIFIGSKVSGATIFSSSGEPIWFLPSRSMDLRPQNYRGRRVLTWFQAPTRGSGLKRNTYMIADRRYRTIKRVYPGRGLKADSHEFRLTPRGTAFVTAYKAERRDLRPVGMSKNGAVSDSIAQEVDIRTGRVVWEWRSLDHVPIRDTFAETPRRPGNPFDYFHINSIIDTPDGNVLISGRSTNAVYKVSRRTGRVIWTLGGKRSDFRMGKGARFSSQHDAQLHRNGLISIFDNGDSPVISKPVRKQSRGVVLKLNFRRKTARVHRRFFHPKKPLASTQANLQRLKGGNYFVGWGGVPLISEHGPNGNLLFDAELRGISSFYRAYRGAWSGAPRTRPAVIAEKAGERTRFWVSWNGDSRVREWRVYTGPAKNRLRLAGTRKREGFETVAAVPGNARYLRVVGLNPKGKAIGRSTAVRIR